MNETLPQSIASEDWVGRYEQLRQDVLNQNPGGSFGLIVLLRQGMIAWMRAWAVPPVIPPAREHIPIWNTTTTLPSDVRAEAAIILAGILLRQSPETTLCKATCTR